MLALGQVVRYEGTLWRVDFLNDCRARIVPLTKQHVTILDDDGTPVRSFDRQGRGVNISPNSVLDIVDDPERAAAELELEAAEREVARLRAETAKQTAPWVGPPAGESIAQEVADLVGKRKAARAPGDWKPLAQASGPAPPSGWRWHPGAADMTEWVAFQKPDSLKKAVLEMVIAQPGRTTKEIATDLAPAHTSGAVSACLDRFQKANILKRSSAK